MNAKALSWTLLIATALTACHAQTTAPDGSSGDSGGNPIDAVAPNGAFGAPCRLDQDCSSNVCLASGHCSRPCSTTVDCLAGWTCAPSAGVGNLCQCVASSEICDGLDNDCDGIVDFGAICPPLEVCVAGACFGTSFDVARVDATDTGAACDVVQDMDSGTCLRETTCGNTAFCPSRVTNDPAHPQFVIAQMDILSPTVLGPRMPIGSILNTAIPLGKFFWGLDIDLTGNTIRTGGLHTDMPEQPGAGFLGNDFHFVFGAAPAGDAGLANRWDPITGIISVAGDSFSTSTLGMVSVPVYGNPTDAGQATVLLELPLRQLRMHDVRMTSGRNCIGLAKSPFASCLSNRWYTSDPTTDAGMNSFGVLEGDLTVADTDAIVVSDIPGMPTMCGLIAGTGSNCSVPMSMWRTPPESTASGPGWHLVANFAGYAARIH